MLGARKQALHRSRAVYLGFQIQLRVEALVSEYRGW